MNQANTLSEVCQVLFGRLCEQNEEKRTWRVAQKNTKGAKICIVRKRVWQSRLSFA